MVDGLWLMAEVRRTFVVAALLAMLGQAHAGESRVLCDFEDAAAVKMWDFTAGSPKLVAEGVTQGRRALEITFDPKGRYQPGYIYWRRVPRDWSQYDALVLDVFNPGDAPIPGYVLVADEAWEQKGRTYWNRHNGRATFAPGQTQWVIPVRGLYRGEAGSRNNDIKRNIDPDRIVRVDFGFGRKGAAGRIIIDNLRFVKTSRPAGVWAFDFGPPSQSVMLGWTPVSHQTRYTAKQGYGWGPRGGAPWKGAARDTTFGTMLLQDFCEARRYNFHIDVPPGRYKVVVFYENSGYWGGEQAMQRERRILANGKLAWSESRPDGPAHALYRFENVEPVGVDLWDTYMAAELAKPARFEAHAGRNGLTLRFEADRAWGSKVAALVVYSAEDGPAGAWVEDQFDKLAKEFRRKAVCLDKPIPRKRRTKPAWQEAGLVASPMNIEHTVVPGMPLDPPVDTPEALELSGVAVRGEYEPLCLAVRPSRDFGECDLVLDPFTGPGKLDAKVQVVWYNTSRGFNTIAYRIMPHTLRDAAKVSLPASVTREIVVTVRVPEDAKPGEYRGRLTIKQANGDAVLRVPLRLTVSPVVLDRETDFLMGFFGLMPPRLIPDAQRWDVLEETLVLLREHGMNAVSGGPSWRLKGWRDGEPVIDFGDMDRFFALLRKHGFTRPLNGYGGARFNGLHGRYEKGRPGAAVEKQSGLPYEEALMRAWRAVDAHARAAGWPTIFYAMCDETRVRERAERELPFMRMMAKVSAAFPKTVRTSGSYSVHFRSRPKSRADMLYWHQRFFEALDINSLNRHDASVMAEARRLGKEVHIYNQGRTRYSFGLYQWSEYRKGVRARWQWHLNILHGYQFFDLDGREPDTAMICYGRDAIYPTIHFERCREGADDFYLYNTLWRVAQARRTEGKRGGAVAQAEALLGRLESSVKLDQRQPPQGYDAGQLKREVIAAIEKLAP